MRLKYGVKVAFRQLRIGDFFSSSNKAALGMPMNSI